MSKRLSTGGYRLTPVSSDTADIASIPTTRVGRCIIFPYTGGKSLLAPQLIRIIEDAAKHYALSEYRELYGGSAQVKLNLKPGLFKQYWYNDTDQDIVNLFRVLGDSHYLYELIGLLYQLGVGEDVFKQAKEALKPDKPLTLVESAAYAYITITQSRAAGREKFNSEVHRTYSKVKKYYDRVRALDTFYPFLSRVEFTCKYAYNILEETLGDSYALTYLDPPYSPDSEMSGTKQYKNNMSPKQHEDMARLLVRSHSKIILSGYDNPQYQLLEDCGWSKIFLRNVPVPSSGGKKRADEFCWLNFELSDQLKLELQYEHPSSK